MKWTAEQKKALRESIAHWERMREYRLRDRNDDGDFQEMPDEDYCPCCLRWNFIGNRCSGCPISECTGRAYCQATPYGDAVLAFDSWRAGYGDRRAWVLAAAKEIDFLKAVLEAGE